MMSLVRSTNELREVLHTPLEAVAAKAAEAGRQHYFSARWKIDPRDLQMDFLAATTCDAFLWQEPSRGISLLGLGRVEVIEAVGRDRFERASLLARDVFERMERITLDDDAWVEDSVGPLLVGGFGFYDRETDPESEWRGLGPGRLILPALAITCRTDSTWLTRCCAVEPGDDVALLLERLCSSLTDEPQMSNCASAAVHRDPGRSLGDGARGPEIRVQSDRTHGRYVAQVEAALEAIEAGKIEKVVVARSLRVAAEEDFDLHAFLATLREVYPSCATVAVREGEHHFICATPERLVSLDGDAVRTAAIAGSAPRGRSPQEEKCFSDALLGSEKERDEHEVVKRAIRAALRDVCGELAGPSKPALLKLDGIQHLETPLAGCLNDDAREHTSVLELVGRLHPTPAVGGAPSAAALDWLERFEDLDRGWYAGPIGYVDASGNGEFRVALRSALLRGRVARLFAGAGIVVGSDPGRELAETRLKLRALLAPLTEI
jgi:isochorismate synthase